jgi:RNA polymerase sigma-70 factor (ECF subfamily)
VNEHHKTKEDLAQELELVEAAKKNSARFGLLYEKYYKVIFVFVFRRTGDEELTADITANTFLKAMLNLQKYEYKGVPFSAWLFRIALNEVNMYFRKSSRERTVSLGKEHLGDLIDETGEHGSEENIKLVMLTLSKLPPDAMQLIELRFFEKRPFSEVAHILGLTETNAKVKTHRLLEKMKEMITKYNRRDGK